MTPGGDRADGHRGGGDAQTNQTGENQMIPTARSVLAVACSTFLIASCGGGLPSVSGPAGHGADGEGLAARWIEVWSARHTIDLETYVGSGVVESLGASPVVGEASRERHGQVRVSHGRVHNGVGREKLASYLEQDAREAGGRLRRFGDDPPVVKPAPGTSYWQWVEVRTAVQWINASLPDDWQLRVSDDPASRAAEGEIAITFAARERWPEEAGCTGDPVGCASSHVASSGEVTRGDAWVDPTRIEGRNQRLRVIIHEILHVLGRQHPDPYAFSETLMREWGTDNSGFVLYPLDREALLAVHGRLAPGTPSREVHSRLGPWEDTSTYVSGVVDIPGGSVSFGAAEMNDHVQAWSHGPTPRTTLESNAQLAGDATWRGRLLGLTPKAEVVAGAAGLTVRLATLDGRLDFTELESWAAGAAPGAAGSGARWGDGDLRYPVEIQGNGFWKSPGGDDGVVNGAFFGIAHEGMGGVLDREDLTAGFGGRRE